MLTWSDIKLYFPIILSLLFLFLPFFVRKDLGTTRVKLNLMGLVDISLPIKSSVVVRLLLLVFSLLSFLPILFYDYSSLFPKILNMEVFYDQEGIKRTLAQYSTEELAPYNIPDNYKPWQEKYYDAMTKELNKIIKMQNPFVIKDGVIYSNGHVRFNIESVPGWQHYHLKESSGELNHTIEIPNMRPVPFKTFFDQLPTGANYFNLTLADILIRHGKLLCPTFKQILAENVRSDGILFHHLVVGLISATSFPNPRVAPTIYLAKFENVGYVPIAYAVYSSF